MTGRTSIEWTHQPGYVGAVWNPTVGCTRVSAGCDNCYAFTLHDQRYKANLDACKVDIEWATLIAPAAFTTGSTPPQVARRNGIPLPLPEQYDLPFSRVQLLEDRLGVPLRTRKPTCYFVDSMADLFHEDVPYTFIRRVFDTMRSCDGGITAATGKARPSHRFLILTKRPDRMRELATTRALGFEPANPPANVWLGTSVEDQRSADARIPHLLATPAAVRFLSCEPLLGPVRIDEWIAAPGEALVLCPSCKVQRWVGPRTCGICGAPPPASIDWVIVGGESGPRARPMDLAWARSLRDQCRDAGVAVFMKQLGSKPYRHGEERGEHPMDSFPVAIRESHGRDVDEWPTDLHVREWPRLDSARGD